MSDSRPLLLRWETHGAEDNEDQAGALGSVSTGCVQNGPHTRLGSMPALHHRAFMYVYAASPGWGQSDQGRSDVSVERTTGGMVGISSQKAQC